MALPRPSVAAMNSPNDSHCQSMPASSTSRDIASTLIRSHSARSRVSGRHGARPTPQLPITVVVTPCQAVGVTSGSQDNCAS